MLKSLIVAFSTYSKLPMPQFEWKEENMRYSMCFFPFIGVVMGICAYGIDVLSAVLTWSELFRAAILTVLPLLITGGIHMDGFLDTIDARRSYKGKEARLEILKDPHVGAFAVIYGIVLVVIQLGAYSQVKSTGVILVGIGYVFSRTLSGLSVITFPKAKKDGMVRSVSDAAQKAQKRVKYVLLGEAVAAAAIMIAISLLRGSLMVLAGVVVFLYYRRMSEGEFGGTTGDLAGWFLVMCETVMLLVAAI